MIPYDIVVVAGQSNAEGSGLGSVEHEYRPSPRAWSMDVEKTVEHLPDTLKVTYCDAPFQIQIAQEREFNGEKVGEFGLSFIRNYESECLKNGRGILLLHCAVGGSGFYRREWTTDGQLYQKMLEMIDYALSLNEENRLVAFLWHQGECDAWEGTPPAQFHDELREMLCSIRERYALPQLPVVAGDVSLQWKEENRQIVEPIVEQIKLVMNEIGSGAFVKTDDLLTNDQQVGNGDILHFSREALYVMGERYFRAFSDIGRKNGENAVVSLK